MGGAGCLSPPVPRTAQSERTGDEALCCAPVMTGWPAACVKLALLGSHKPCKAGPGLLAGPAIQKWCHKLSGTVQHRSGDLSVLRYCFQHKSGLSIYLSICLSACLPACLPACLSVSQSVRLQKWFQCRWYLAAAECSEQAAYHFSRINKQGSCLGHVSMFCQGQGSKCVCHSNTHELQTNTVGQGEQTTSPRLRKFLVMMSQAGHGTDTQASCCCCCTAPFSTHWSCCLSHA